MLKFISYPPALKKLCVRVLLLAVYYKLLIHFRKFSAIAGRLGRAGRVTSEDPVPDGQREYILQVRRFQMNALYAHSPQKKSLKTSRRLSIWASRKRKTAV